MKCLYGFKYSYHILYNIIRFTLLAFRFHLGSYIINGVCSNECQSGAICLLMYSDMMLGSMHNAFLTNVSSCLLACPVTGASTKQDLCWVIRYGVQLAPTQPSLCCRALSSTFWWSAVSTVLSLHGARFQLPLSQANRAARFQLPLSQANRAARFQLPLSQANRAARFQLPLSQANRAARFQLPLSQANRAARFQLPLSQANRAARFHLPSLPGQ